MTNHSDDERDIDLVLVTGAGASHEFGASGTKVPLMGSWSDALVTKIQRASWSYLEATGLQAGLEGHEFEVRLGRFLQLAQSLPRIEQVLKPSLEFQVPAVGLVEQSLRDWHRTTTFHVGQITDLIHQSLYESFSYERIDLDAAAKAYGTLLQQLGVSYANSTVYATTNYDVVGEYVIERLDGLPDWGEQNRLIIQGESPLRVERLLDGMPRYVPILHLHGRVGWYRRDDGRAYCSNTTMHSAEYGVPIVMLPDPAKAYNGDPVIAEIWTQFEEALQRARRVFVLGHSLNDPQLLQALQRNVSPPERVAVTILAHPDNPDELDPSGASVYQLLGSELQSASIIPIRFAANQVDIRAAVATWEERLSAAVERHSA